MSEELSLAENINTPADRLVKLAKTEDKKILAAIAKNPNTPIDLLIKLAGEYLYEIGENPALDLILFENPNFISDIYYDEHEHYYYYCETDYEDYDSISILLPDWFVKLASSDRDPDIRIYIASNKHTSALYLEQLATDESDRVRANVAHHKNTPPSILEKLSQDEDHMVKQCVAINKNTPIPILEKLSQYQDTWGIIRGQVAGNINTPVYILEKLAKEEDRYLNIGLGKKSFHYPIIS